MIWTSLDPSDGKFLSQAEACVGKRFPRQLTMLVSVTAHRNVPTGPDSGPCPEATTVVYGKARQTKLADAKGPAPVTRNA